MQQSLQQRPASATCLSAEADPWIQALQDASGKSTGGLLGLEGLSKGSKLKGLRGPQVADDQRLEQNSVLLKWLAENGVWVYDKSDWGEAPHSLAVAVDTVDENENERAGRGMIANKEIKEGDELFHIPLEMLLTKDRAEKEFGKNVITDDLSEYIAIALLLIGEAGKGSQSFWKPYIDVLPTLEEVMLGFHLCSVTSDPISRGFVYGSVLPCAGGPHVLVG